MLTPALPLTGGGAPREADAAGPPTAADADCGARGGRAAASALPPALSAGRAAAAAAEHVVGRSGGLMDTDPGPNPDPPCWAEGFFCSSLTSRVRASEKRDRT